MSAVVDVARAGIFGGARRRTTDATLFDATTGQVVANKGIPDGRADADVLAGRNVARVQRLRHRQAHGLALMQLRTKTHTASDYKMLIKRRRYMRPGLAVHPA